MKNISFKEVFVSRRSVRRFESRKFVSDSQLRRTVDCGRWAPSVTNEQFFDFVVIGDPKL